MTNWCQKWDRFPKIFVLKKKLLNFSEKNPAVFNLFVYRFVFVLCYSCSLFFMLFQFVCTIVLLCVFCVVENQPCTGCLGPWKNDNQSWTCLSKSEHSGNCRVVSYFVFRDTGCICFRDVLCIIATGGF